MSKMGKFILRTSFGLRPFQHTDRTAGCEGFILKGFAHLVVRPCGRCTTLLGRGSPRHMVASKSQCFSQGCLIYGQVITYLPKAAGLLLSTEFLTSRYYPSLRLFSVIGTVGNQLCDSIEILSPAGNYLSTYLTFLPKVRLFPVTGFALYLISHFCPLLYDILFSPRIITVEPYQKLKNTSVCKASVFPLSFPSQSCFRTLMTRQ